MAECQKIVKRNAFEKAIEIGDEPSAAEGLDIDSMAVEPEYDGVQLEQEMTQEFIDDMIERFKNGKKIHKKYVYQIILAVKKIVYDEATMVEMKIPDDATMTVCGDTHGMTYLIVILGAMLTCSIRSIFRFDGTFQTEWASDGEALLFVQWRLC